MDLKLASSCFVVATLMLPVAGYAANSERSSATAYVNESVITSKIKSELAAEKLSSLVNISVETDNKGVVTLASRVNSKNAAEKTVAIAQPVKGVISLENHIKIVAEK